MKVLVTGGAGFIGSYLIQYWLKKDPSVSIVNLDKLTYCGDLRRLEPCKSNSRYQFVQGDVCNTDDVKRAMKNCTHIVHLASETHVDRSLLGGKEFFDTNLYGTYVLLEEAKKNGIKKFVYVSTDEVYGSRATGFFVEKDSIKPTSPYSISKAAADLLALSYAESYGMPVVVTRGSNTFGPYQYPEKVIPLFVSNALSDLHLPLYGDGRQVRNWLHVEDHATGILTVLAKGKDGEAYNISSDYYLMNKDLAKLILKTLGRSSTLIKKVTDRIGHDRRYALKSTKLQKLGWKSKNSHEDSLKDTFLWYRQNESWWKKIKEQDAQYKAYYAEAYKGRA